MEELSPVLGSAELPTRPLKNYDLRVGNYGSVTKGVEEEAMNYFIGSTRSSSPDHLPRKTLKSWPRKLPKPT